MAKLKTNYTGEPIDEFISRFVENDQKKADTYKLISLLKDWSGFEPKMWGPSIIAFGNYHYKYASGHEGDAPILSFSPRKNALTLYVFSNTEKNRTALEKLGKFKITKACIYVKKLYDINLDVLKEICLESKKYIEEHDECSCRNVD